MTKENYFKNIICGRIKKIMLICKERKIIKELYDFIWGIKHDQLLTYKYQNNGVPLEDFMRWLDKKYIQSAYRDRWRNFWIFHVAMFFNKKYLDEFLTKQKNTIKACIVDNYIEIPEKAPLLGNTILTIKTKGQRLIELPGFVVFIESLFGQIPTIIAFISGGLLLLFIKLVLHYVFRIDLPL